MISLTSVAKCQRKSFGSRFCSGLSFRNSVNDHKAEAKKLVLIENVGNGRLNKQKPVNVDIFPDQYQCDVQKVWSWTFKRRNFFLLKLSTNEDVEKFQQNCGFNPHAFPVRTRMIDSSVRFPSDETYDSQPFDFNNIATRKNLNSSQLRNEFTSEGLVKYFESIHSLSELDLNLRYFLITQLEDVLCQGIFSDFKIFPFGSSLAGLGDSSSDLDIALLKLPNTQTQSTTNEFCHPEVKSERDQIQQSLSLIADIARYFLPNLSQINRILRARVPIIKMSFDSAPIQIDLSIELSEENGHHGFIMANYINYCTKLDPKIKQFFVILKLWARQHGIVKSMAGNWFTNFQLITLAIYFLQSKGILSSMEKFKTLPLSSGAVSVPEINELLNEFLEFVVSFDFEKKGISILQNETFTKPDYAPIYIENPIERDLNICKNINGHEFKKFLLTAYNSLDAMHNTDFHIADLLDVEYFKKLEAQTKI